MPSITLGWPIITKKEIECMFHTDNMCLIDSYISHCNLTLPWELVMIGFPWREHYWVKARQ